MCSVGRKLQRFVSLGLEVPTCTYVYSQFVSTSVGCCCCCCCWFAEVTTRWRANTLNVKNGTAHYQRMVFFHHATVLGALHRPTLSHIQWKLRPRAPAWVCNTTLQSFQCVADRLIPNLPGLCTYAIVDLLFIPLRNDLSIWRCCFWSRTFVY